MLTGDGKNLALAALRESLRGPHDCGGPLDGWNLSPEDVTLFLARHRAIQNGAMGPGALDKAMARVKDWQGRK